MNKTSSTHSANLKKTAISSAQWKAAATIIISVLALIQLFVLTKFISAQVFGVIAIGRVVLGFMMHLSDSGMRNAVLVKQSLSDQLFSTIYWINIGIILLLTFISYLFIPWICDVYEMPSLTHVLYIFLIAFIAHGMGSYYKALLQKYLKIKTISFIDIIAMIIAVILTISLAIINPVASAIAYGILANIVISSIGYILYGFHIHPLKLQFQSTGLRYFVSFGGYQLGERLLNYFHNKIDILIIGKVLGSEILGVYDIFKQLLNRPESLINPILDFVALPIMAKKEFNLKSISKIYLRMMSYSATILFPIYATLIVIAPQLVLYFFGTAWTNHVLLFQLIAGYFIIHSTMNHVGTLWVAVSKPSYGLYWNMAVWLIFPITIYLASYFSINIVIIAMSASLLVLFYPMFIFVIKKLIPLSWDEYISPLIIPLWINALLSIPLFLLYNWTDNILIKILLLLVFSISLLKLYKLNHKQTLIELISLFKK